MWNWKISPESPGSLGPSWSGSRRYVSAPFFYAQREACLSCMRVVAGLTSTGGRGFYATVSGTVGGLFVAVVIVLGVFFGACEDVAEDGGDDGEEEIEENRLALFNKKFLCLLGVCRVQFGDLLDLFRRQWFILWRAGLDHGFK